MDPSQEPAGTPENPNPPGPAPGARSNRNLLIVFGVLLVSMLSCCTGAALAGDPEPVVRSSPSPYPSPSPSPYPSPSPSPVVVTVAPRPVAPQPRAPRPAPRRTTTRPAPPPEPRDVHYANCSEARAAGVTPLYAGEPGYRAGLDRDGDGVACE